MCDPQKMDACCLIHHGYAVFAGFFTNRQRYYLLSLTSSTGKRFHGAQALCHSQCGGEFPDRHMVVAHMRLHEYTKPRGSPYLYLLIR